MKIGFSLGKCVRDIVNGSVSFVDVVVIVTRPNLSKEEHFDQPRRAHGYGRSYWGGLDVDECWKISLDLFRAGKLHQPRQYGAQYHSPVAADFVWMDLAPTINSANPMVADAWAKYQMLAKLSAQDARKLKLDDAAAAIAPSNHMNDHRDTPLDIAKIGIVGINEQLDAKARAKLDRPPVAFDDNF